MEYRPTPGERVRVKLVNGESPARQPRKKVVIVQPGAAAQFDRTADAPAQPTA